MIRFFVAFRIPACLVAISLAGALFAQTGPYTVTTIAGGGPPSPASSTAIAFNWISGVAVDTSGNVYVADQQQHRVYKLTPSGIATAVAGTGVAGYSGDNIPAATAQLSTPTGLALDSVGNLYIADSVNCRVRKVSAGIINTVAGTGICGYSGDNIPAGGAQLAFPNAVAVDPAGNLYISDASNYRIRKVSAGTITTIAGNGSSGYSGDNGLAISAQISSPYAIAVDSAGRVFVADGQNYRVRKIEASLITTVAGTGVWGSSGDNGPATSATFGWITGLALDSGGNLYIADASALRIRKVSSGTVTSIAGNGSYGYSGDGGLAVNAAFANPYGVAVDNSGNLYVADSGNYRLRKIVNGVISTFAGNGTFSYSGDNGPAAAAQLSPRSIAVMSPGNIYVADQQDFRVRNISGGWITTAAGNGTPCCGTGDGGLATNAGLNGVNGVAVDGTGSFYTSDGTRIRKVSGGIINAFAGNGLSAYSGDNGPAINAGLSSSGVAVDAVGNVYIADSQARRVRKVSGGVITTIAGGGPSNGAVATSVSLAMPPGVASDAAGNLYVPSNDHRVYRISTGGTISIVAGNGSAGFSGDNGNPTAAQLNTPYGVAVNSAGSVVYIADRGNNRVRMVAGGVITTVTGGNTVCLAATNSIGDGCPGASAILYSPTAVALDSSASNLYIADSLNYRIRKLTLSTGVITTVAGVGQCTTNPQNGTCLNLGDNGPATSAQLNYATSMALDPTNGDLYIGDSENFRVRKVSAATGIITTFAGTGVYGYNGDGIPATTATLTYCYGVAVDASGNVYIADAANHRIRKVSASGTITTVAGTGVYGFSGDGLAATGAQIYNPYAIALDGANNFYIADTKNNRIRKVAGGIITTVAGNGLTSFSGDGGQALNAQLSSPSAVAVDSGGTVYISDAGNLRIRAVSPGGVISTVAGNGTWGFSGEFAPATGPIGYVPAIAVDNIGNLYLADAGFSRIRVVANGVIATIAGTGFAGYSGDGGPGLNAMFNNPQGIAVDSLGNIYVADTGNSRVRLLTTSAKSISQLSPSTIAAGSAAFSLQVSGSGFLNGDTVQWNGTPLPTTFVNSGTLTAAVWASLVSSPGAAASITVNGVSNAAVFRVLSTPALTSLTPNTASVSGGAVSITANGINFLSGAAVQWTPPGGGSTVSLPASFINSAQLQATIPSSLLTTPGTAQVAVINPDDVTTNSLPFVITSAPAGPLRFVPVTPCRIADTRNVTGPFGGPMIQGGTTRSFDVPGSACGIPVNAQAYSLNVAVVPGGPLGYLTVWPTGQSRPNTSTLNSLDGRIKSNAAIVPAGTNGAISVYPSNSSDVILDINGYFVPATDPSGLAFYPISPCRVADTRNPTAPLGGPFIAGGGTRSFPVLSSACGIPAAARSYSFNLTAVPRTALGYLTAWGNGGMPNVSALNAPTGTATANAAIVPADSNGAINVFASNATDLVIDINGYFAPMGIGGLSLYNVPPCRTLDTRQNSSTPFSGTIAVGVSAGPCGVPGSAQAVVLAATVVPPAPLGYLTLWPQGQTVPNVATLNALDSAITSNMAIVPTANGSVSAFPSNPVQLILDVFAYFAP